MGKQKMLETGTPSHPVSPNTPGNRLRLGGEGTEGWAREMTASLVSFPKTSFCLLHVLKVKSGPAMLMMSLLKCRCRVVSKCGGIVRTGNRTPGNSQRPGPGVSKAGALGRQPGAVGQAPYLAPGTIIDGAQQSLMATNLRRGEGTNRSQGSALPS